MKIITSTEWVWDDSIQAYVEAYVESQDYSGPVSLCTGAEAAVVAPEVIGGAEAAGAGKAAMEGAGALEGFSGGMSMAPEVMSGFGMEGLGMTMAPMEMPFYMEAAAAPSFFGGAMDSLSSMIGLSPQQMAMQGALQGGAALFQGMGANQNRNAQNNAYDIFNQRIDSNTAGINNAFDAAANPYGNFTSDVGANKNSLIATYDATRPTFHTGLENMPESTPDVVKLDMARRMAETDDASRAQYASAADMTAFSNLLGMRSLNNAEQLRKIGSLQANNKTAQAQLQQGLALGANAGSTMTGVGDMMSSTGNLLLASQLSKKAKE